MRCLRLRSRLPLTCGVAASLLFACSPAPVRPAPTPQASLEQSLSPCAEADADERARELQRTSEVERLRSELQEHPEDAERWARLGSAYGYADSAFAIDAFERATRLAPEVASHWMQLGEAYWSNRADDPRALELAKGAFTTCLERDARHGDCHCLLGVVQRSEDDPGAALLSFTKAVEHGAACEYELAQQLASLGELERSSLLVRRHLARSPVQPADFDRLYRLQEVALTIAEQRGDRAQADAARRTLADYTLGVSSVFAFNLGSVYAISQPPEPTKAQQLLARFVQSSCLPSDAANDCARCVVAHALLDRLASAKR